jgi:hypothetical protein
MSSIKPGQVYREAAPRDGQYPTRILVKSWAPYGAGHWGAGRAQVVTLTSDGREVRPRSIKLDQLHMGPINKNGQPRRTGYVLEAASRG